MKVIKLNEFIEELKIQESVAEPMVKPITKPSPTTTPNRPSPLRRDKPSVVPAPKADVTVEDLAKKFIDLTTNNKEINSLLVKKYGNKK